MIHAFQAIALGFGALGLTAGLWALYAPETVQRFLRKLPRNQGVGRLLVAIDVAWSLYLFNLMSLGSWDRFKPLAMMLGPLIYLFIIFYVNDYLGARGVAWLLILIAKPVVNICFLRHDAASLVVTTLAYIMVLFGICFFSVPHWFRDWIGFWTADRKRWNWGSGVKIGLGCLLLAIGIVSR